MPSQTPESREQFLSALRADQSERWQRGERVRAESYLEQYPELAGDPEAVLRLIQQEVLLRLGSGERPALDEYLERFAPHADPIRQAWAHLHMANPELASRDPDSTASEAHTLASPHRGAKPLSLPGFELFEELGKGGMGVVLRARDVALDQPRAIKLIRAGAFAGEEARQRFHTEAKATARLDHPGVVRIFSFGEHDEVLFICMELLPGGSLQARLCQGPLGIREAAELVRQLALAVQHAHDKGVLHRDLKPANILLSGDGTPRVSDFGLAKLLDADDGLTRTGAIMGTASYMAPEQAEGRTDTTGERTDVYSLGAILYECLIGKPPFKAESRARTLELVKNQPPTPPGRLRAAVPRELASICLKCLEKSPEQRYDSAAGLAEDLERWLRGLPTVARPPSRIRRLGRALRRSARIWSLTLFAAVGLGVGAVAWLAPRHGPPSEKADNQPDAKTVALEGLRSDLSRGGVIDLFGSDGAPRWSRWPVEPKGQQGTPADDGSFMLRGWHAAVLELAPQVESTHFRLRAQVRCRDVDGWVGLYVRGTPGDEGGPLRYRCCLLRLQMFGGGPGRMDLCVTRFEGRPERDEVFQDPLGLSRSFPGAVRAGSSVGQVAIPSAPLVLSALRAASSDWDRWYDMVMEVRGEEVFWWLDSIPGKRVSFRKSQVVLQMWDKHTPILSPRGGVGLYVRNGTGWFKNVRVEMLPE
jgi:serine/threonine protein kinase